MARSKNRKGIFVVLFGLLFLVLMGAAAISIDMSRIWTMRNELQTAADAGALGGAIQMTPPHNTAKNIVIDTATKMARLNRAMYDTIKVDSVQTGIWDDDAGTFTLNATPANAVHVVVSHGTNKMIMGLLGIAAPRVKARSTAWANAPVNNSSCIRPWSIPYVILMSKVNTAQGIPNTAENLTRAFTDTDRDVLNGMSEADRTFSLKMGSGNGNQTGVDDPPPGSTAPGNFQAVKLPRKRSAAGTLNPDGPPLGGADNYRDAIEGKVCHTLGIGDVLEVQTGNVVGPTLQAVEKENGSDPYYVCADIIDDKNSAAHGNCMSDAGVNGVDIKAAFHVCYTGCNGQSEVTVTMLGSFTLLKVYPDAGKDNAWEKSQIVGVFKPITATGPIGPGPTTLKRIILVR